MVAVEVKEIIIDGRTEYIRQLIFIANLIWPAETLYLHIENAELKGVEIYMSVHFMQFFYQSTRIYMKRVIHINSYSQQHPASILTMPDYAHIVHLQSATSIPIHHPPTHTNHYTNKIPTAPPTPPQYPSPSAGPAHQQAPQQLYSASRPHSHSNSPSNSHSHSHSHSHRPRTSRTPTRTHTRTHTHTRTTRPRRRHTQRRQRIQFRRNRRTKLIRHAHRGRQSRGAKGISKRLLGAA